MAEWQRAISGREFAEWLAYDRIDPIGEMRADLRMGIIAALMANLARDPKKQPLAPADFMLFKDPLDSTNLASEQTWQQQLEIVKMLNEALGGAVIKK